MKRIVAIALWAVVAAAGVVMIAHAGDAMCAEARVTIRPYPESDYQYEYSPCAVALDAWLAPAR